MATVKRERNMGHKKIIFGILAAVITISVASIEACAKIQNSSDEFNYIINVCDIIYEYDNINISDIYGAQVKFTDESAEALKQVANGGFAFISTSDNWNCITWKSGSDADADTDTIIWDSETNTVTRMEKSPFFNDEDISEEPGTCAQIAISQWWGGDIAIDAISLLDANGNIVCTKSMTASDDSDTNEPIAVGKRKISKDIKYTDGTTPSLSVKVGTDIETLKVKVDIASSCFDENFETAYFDWNDYCPAGVAVKYPDNTVKYYQWGGSEVNWDWDVDGDGVSECIGGKNGDNWLGDISSSSYLYIPVQQDCIVDFYCLSYDTYDGVQYTLSFTKSSKDPLYDSYEIDGCVKITHYNGTDTDVVIPDNIGGLPVTIIGERAFYGNDKLKSVTFPDTVTEIYSQAFRNCRALTDVNLDENCRFIWDEAFLNCSSLKYINIPESTDIYNYSLGYERNQNGDYSKVSDFSIKYVKNTGGHIYAASNGFTDEICLITSELSDGTLEIRRYAGTAATYNIPSTIDGKRVTKLENWAFGYSNYLKKVIIPDSVTCIDEGAFDNCPLLSSVNIPDSVTEILYRAFLNCPSLKSVSIPASVKKIDTEAFGFIQSEIGDICKVDGFKLNYVKNTAGHLYAATNGFTDESCTVFNKLKDGTLSIDGYYSNETNYSIPSKVNGIAVTAIGDYAFWNCTKLKSVTVPTGVTSIGSCAFLGCSELADITLPSGLKSIGNYAFGNCSSLKKLTIPEGVTKISEKAFNNCSSLTEVALPNTVKSISDYAFCDCRSLKKLTLPDNLESIGEKAVFNCTSLKSITITASVKKFGNYAVGYYFDENWMPTVVEGLKIYCYSGTESEKYAKNNKIDYALIKCTDHNYPAWKTTKTATYTATGTKTRICSKCGKVETATIAKLTLAKIGGFKVKAKDSTSITLQWNRNANASGYIIEVYNGKTWSQVTKIAKNSTLTYKVTKLSASKTYQYRIKAYKTEGKATAYSANSATLSVNTNPSNMSGFKAKSKTYNGITLQWNKNASATGYELQKWDGKKWVTLTKISKNSTTTYTVKNLKASTTYKYKIRAYKTIGKATQYSAYTATLSVNTNPSNMSGFKAKSKSYNSITLQWNKNASATGYELQKWDGKKWVTLTKIAKNSTTTYTVKSLKASTTYKYRIRAYKTIGKATQYSAYSATLSVNTNPTNMGGFKAKSKSYNSITLQWNKNASATGYELQKWDGKKWVTLTKISKNSTTTYTIKSLKASTTYKYRIRAYKTIGKATQYSTYTTTLSVNTNPTNMSGFKAKSTAKTSVTLQWNKNTSATGYEIQKWNGKKWVSAVKVTKNSTVTSTVKSLKANTSYKFRIRAYKTIGKTTQYSSWSGTLTVKTKK